MAGDPVPQELCVFFLQSQTVVFLILIPFLQFDDQIDVGRVHDSFHAKQGLHIDDADTAKLDEMPCDIRGSPDKCRI